MTQKHFVNPFFQASGIIHDENIGHPVDLMLCWAAYLEIEKDEVGLMTGNSLMLCKEVCVEAFCSAWVCRIVFIVCQHKMYLCMLSNHLWSNSRMFRYHYAKLNKIVIILNLFLVCVYGRIRLKMMRFQVRAVGQMLCRVVW